MLRWACQGVGVCLVSSVLCAEGVALVEWNQHGCLVHDPEIANVCQAGCDRWDRGVVCCVGVRDALGDDDTRVCWQARHVGGSCVAWDVCVAGCDRRTADPRAASACVAYQEQGIDAITTRCAVNVNRYRMIRVLVLLRARAVAAGS